jgi:hypothetical protein
MVSNVRPGTGTSSFADSYEAAPPGATARRTSAKVNEQARKK